MGCSEIVTWKLLFNDDHGDGAANNDDHGPGDDGGGNGEFGDGIKGEEQGIQVTCVNFGELCKLC